MAVGAIKDFIQSPQVHVIWTAMRRIIESIQIFSLLAIPQFEWPVDVLDGIQDIQVFSWMAIDVTGSTYTTILIIVCSIITFYILVVLLSMLCQLCECDCLECISSMFDCDCCDDEISESLWFFIGDALLFGILFVPISRTLLEIYHCKNDMLFKNSNIECGSTEHVLLAIWSAIILLALLAFVFLRANAHDILQHDPRLPSRLRDDIRNFDKNYAFFKFSSLIILIIIAESSPIVASILLVLAFLLPVAYTIHELPYVAMKYNYIRCAMDSFNFWSAFAVFIVSVVDDRDSWAGFIIWCCFPIWIGICCVLCKLRLRKRPLTVRDLREPDDDIDTKVGHQINFDDFRSIKGDDELKQLLTGHKTQCTLMRPDDAQDFLDDLQKKVNGDKGYDLYAIVGCNRSGKKDEEAKKWSNEQVEAFCEIIGQCSNLVLFQLNGWIFEGEQIYTIITALCGTEKKDLKIVDLAENQLGLDEAKAICDLIQEKRKNEWFGNMKEMNFVGNYINSKKWSEELIDVHALGSMIVI